MIHYKLSRDTNGNRIVKIKNIGMGTRGFSIQTLGNLPRTHRNGLVKFVTANEVVNYVTKYGTDRQKQALEIN